jgi:hypothetical protein
MNLASGGKYCGGGLAGGGGCSNPDIGANCLYSTHTAFSGFFLLFYLLNLNIDKPGCHFLAPLLISEMDLDRH